jgi:hypothetical protein
MDAGFIFPGPKSREDILRNLLQPLPTQVFLFRKISLVAMAAAKVAQIGDVPLDVKRAFHEYQEANPRILSAGQSDFPLPLFGMKNHFRTIL